MGEIHRIFDASAFFIVDNNLKVFQVKDITYEKYVEMLKSELFDNKNFNNIIKRLEKLG